MTWMDNFYLSENITDNRSAVKRKINWTNNILEYYLLTVSDKNSDDVSIIPALEFKMLPDIKKNKLVVVGVSNGYTNARKLLNEIRVDAIDVAQA